MRLDQRVTLLVFSYSAQASERMEKNTQLLKPGAPAKRVLHARLPRNNDSTYMYVDIGSSLLWISMFFFLLLQKKWFGRRWCTSFQVNTTASTGLSFIFGAAITRVWTASRYNIHVYAFTI